VHGCVCPGNERWWCARTTPNEQNGSLPPKPTQWEGLRPRQSGFKCAPVLERKEVSVGSWWRATGKGASERTPHYTTLTLDGFANPG
jgi:hypothetical protein